MKKGSISFNTMSNAGTWFFVIIIILLLSLVFLYALNTISPNFTWWD